MIVKSYSVYCDICDKPLGCYYGYKPSYTKLRAEGIKVLINNGKAQTLCQKCFALKCQPHS